MEKMRLLILEPDAQEQLSLTQLFQTLDGPWKIEFASSIPEVEVRLKAESWVGVIASSNFPAKELALLLLRTSNLYPSLIRFLWYDATTTPAIEKMLKAYPYSLSREWTPAMVGNALQRCVHMEQWLSNWNTRTLMGKMKQVPSIPILYTQLMQQLQSPESEIDDIAMLISKDVALSAKMLKTVNSPLFGLSKPVNSAFESVIFLGVERTKALVLFTQFSAQVNVYRSRRFNIELMWQHSMAVASYARWIALEETSDPAQADTAFTAGLLHDIGKLLLASNMADLFDLSIDLFRKNNILEIDAERQVFGITHAEFGACLMGNWGLPLPILEAIAWHHLPGCAESKGFSALTAVHAANIFEFEKTNAASGKQSPPFDMGYLQSIGYGEHVDKWRALCLSSS